MLSIRQTDNDHPRPNGFTLIEMSIVLIIVGLVIGGIVVGGELTNSANIRAAITQVENYNAAFNTFRLKYGGLPGDLQASRAAVFGFLPRRVLGKASPASFPS